MRIAGANLETEIAKVCEQQWHWRRERMGCPVGGLDHDWVKGVEKKGKKTCWVMDRENGRRECYLCQKLQLLSSKDSPLMTPPSLLFTPIFSPALLCHGFSIFSPTFPSLSVFCSVSLFSSFLSLCELQQKADGAGLTSEWAAATSPWRERRSWRSREREAEESTPKVMTASWRGVFPFLPPPFWNLKEFQFISSHLLPGVFSLQHIPLYLPSEIERNGSSGSEVMKEHSFRNAQWDIRRREERIEQGCLQIFLKSCVFIAFPQHFLCHVHFLIWSMWRQQFPGKEHVLSPCSLCLLCMSSLRAITKKNSGVLLHVRTHWCPHCGGVAFDLKANWPLTFVSQ